MKHDLSYWAVLAIGIAIGLVVGAPVGAAFIIVRARYRLLRTATINARAHVGGMARILGTVAGISAAAVIAVVGLAAGWWPR